MKRYVKRIIPVFALLAMVAGIFTGCSDDDDVVPVVKEGVRFQLYKTPTYRLTGVEMDEIASLIITVRNSSGVQQVLPSVDMSVDPEDEDLRNSTAVTLAAGNYELVQMVGYNYSGAVLFETEIYKDIQFTVASGEVLLKRIPLEIKVVTNNDFQKNAFEAFCREVFGDDESKWPWDMDEDIKEWDYVEWYTDDQLFILGLCLTGEAWQGLEYFPAKPFEAISTLSDISIVDIPGFKGFKDLDAIHNLTSLLVKGTAMDAIPENLDQYRYLRMLTIIENPITTIPAEIANCSALWYLNLRGNRITTVDLPLQDLEILETVDLSENPITSIATGVFGASESIEAIHLRETNLSSLPSDMATMKNLHYLILDGSNFSEIPAGARNPQLDHLSMDNNNVSTIPAGSFTNFHRLHTLKLAGNPISADVKIDAPAVNWLDLSNTGLSVIPDLSNLPQLRELTLDNNKFTSIPKIDFTANPYMRILSLAGNSSLTSLPAAGEIIGLPLKENGVPTYFRYLNLALCNSLSWTVPADWKAIDYDGRSIYTHAPSDDTPENVAFEQQVTVNRTKTDGSLNENIKLNN